MGGRGLKRYSEENLEALHKVLRYQLNKPILRAGGQIYIFRFIRTSLSRKTNARDNYRDCLRHMNFRSDPVLHSFTKVTVRCGLCGEQGDKQQKCFCFNFYWSYLSGHNRKTCDFAVRDKDPDLWSRKADYFRGHPMMDEENEINEEEEEEEDLSDPEDSLEDYLTADMDEAVPWMPQYETQARGDLYFDGSNFYDDDQQDDAT